MALLTPWPRTLWYPPKVPPAPSASPAASKNFSGENMDIGYRFVFRWSYALAAVLGLTASPAFAQYIPRAVEQPGLGETYHVEASAGFWSPGADMSIS